MHDDEDDRKRITGVPLIIWKRAGCRQKTVPLYIGIVLAVAAAVADRQTGKHISGVPLIKWNFVNTEVREGAKYD